MTAMVCGRGGRHKVRGASFGKGYAQLLTTDPDWERFLRHHTAIGEQAADVFRVAEEAVIGLTEYTRPGDRQALILRALAGWRAEKAKSVRCRVKPQSWTPSDRYAYVHDLGINGA